MSPFRSTRQIAFAALALAVAQPAPASAQGFFEMLFGGRPQQREYVPQQSNAFADPFGSPDQTQPSAPPMNTGRVVSYCVRTCDGRYFPMQRYANASPAQLCNTFCPASKTQVYTGSDINYAVAPNGTRYGEAENAFLYRKQVVPGCTCNGRDAFGLAPVDPANDPTLRAGDIVVTAEGPMSFKGNKWTRAALDIRTSVPPPAAPADAIEPGDQSVNKD